MRARRGAMTTGGEAKASSSPGGSMSEEMDPGGATTGAKANGGEALQVAERGMRQRT